MIILVTGSQGSGKTVILTRYAYAAYKAGQKVYSNYDLSFPHDRLDFEKMMSCEYKDATIVISEAHNWGLDARDAMREPNKSLVKSFIPQVRKQGVYLICDSQRWQAIDKRLRLNCDIWIMCRKHAFLDGRWKTVLQSHQYPKETPVKIECSYNFIDEEREYTNLILANDYYDMYDTRETVQTVEQADNYDKQKKIKKTDKKKISEKKKTITEKEVSPSKKR